MSYNTSLSYRESGESVFGKSSKSLFKWKIESGKLKVKGYLIRPNVFLQMHYGLYFIYKTLRKFN
ncbi:hypothetical protein EZS27_025296 [termite gut metagenome]|uniref:Uncharacterized protein n=1 Tax=termite gut metagenome TaxID=433724 RepID=A0A5J4QUK6_9ZZZZ